MSTPSLRAVLDLGHRSDPAVDGEDELDAVFREARDRCVGRDAVAFLEPAREVPDDVGAELSQRQRRKCCRADAVDVVVAVHADPLAPLDGCAQPLDGRRHVTEEQWVVRDALGLEERAGGVGISQTAAHEHGCDRLRDAERSPQGRYLGERHRLELPAPDHAATIGPEPDGV